VNLLKSRFRRTTAIVAGAVLGLGGALALVSPASAHTGELTSKSDCTDTGWKTTWSLKTWATNGKDGVFSQVTEKGTGSALKVFVEGGKVTGDGTFTDEQTFGKDVASAELKFHITWQDGNNTYHKDVYADAKPEKQCDYPTPTPTPTVKPTPTPTATTTAPGEPTPILEEDCTTITIGASNPAEGKEISLKFETSKGETRTTVIKPGETKTEKFSAVPGFTVKVTPTGIPGAKAETVAYEKPDNCDTSGSGGGLPVTGAAAGTIAGGAALLLAIGAVMFVVSRRRKVKFTA
jgi:hypothetical protein